MSVLKTARPNAVSADLSFRILSLPIAKPRQSRRDRFQPSPAVQAYHAWADLVRLTARRFYRREPYAGAVSLAATFILPIPASWSKEKRLAAGAGTLFHTSKPDLDNLIKGIKDPLSAVLWVDDRQVIEYLEPCWKRYGTAESVGAYIDVWFLDAPL